MTFLILIPQVPRISVTGGQGVLAALFIFHLPSFDCRRISCGVIFLRWHWQLPSIFKIDLPSLTLTTPQHFQNFGYDLHTSLWCALKLLSFLRLFSYLIDIRHYNLYFKFEFEFCLLPNPNANWVYIMWTYILNFNFKIQERKIFVLSSDLNFKIQEFLKSVKSGLNLCSDFKKLPQIQPVDIRNGEPHLGL